mmetsp:Transcript_40919/g.46491  ORF Transcript_40919/g.46491 Transcript_40919/m.46491 type:complete len:460 (+) Transcript_40919:48-1427(+)|eukprot:CAMPEP_0194147106 /NCGR_PEP_ID=MMETSP0152-20130528/22525_1 /TAXON_ID=1049557 /ORGANISM="Thalassiothrix antarctica, Strain L6-D1" /LENGTH=459 /DNA_ID=CAMNT_0038847799 /DNA_START=25 /DNA_END=1404 /DNA_ORIENTATION=-
MEILWRRNGEIYVEHEESALTLPRIETEPKEMLPNKNTRKGRRVFPWFSAGNNQDAVINLTAEESDASRDGGLTSPRRRKWDLLYCWKKSTIQRTPSLDSSISSFPMIIGKKFQTFPKMMENHKKSVDFPTQTRHKMEQKVLQVKKSNPNLELQDWSPLFDSDFSENSESCTLRRNYSSPNETVTSPPLHSPRQHSPENPSSQKPLFRNNLHEKDSYKKTKTLHFPKKNYLASNLSFKKQSFFHRSSKKDDEMNVTTDKHLTCAPDFSPFRDVNTHDQLPFSSQAGGRRLHFGSFPEFEKNLKNEVWFSDYDSPLKRNFAFENPRTATYEKENNDETILEVNPFLVPLGIPKNLSQTPSVRCSNNRSKCKKRSVSNNFKTSQNSPSDNYDHPSRNKMRPKSSTAVFMPLLCGDEFSLMSLDSLVASYWDPDDIKSPTTPLTSNCYHEHLDFLQTRITDR